MLAAFRGDIPYFQSPFCLPVCLTHVPLFLCKPWPLPFLLPNLLLQSTWTPLTYARLQLPPSTPFSLLFLHVGPGSEA